jgi:methyltransferase-like protein/2-polyprenyl-3-methyl-5-hydroxy-6-metoxy-1,4-benzoquinol methylase
MNIVSNKVGDIDTLGHMTNPNPNSYDVVPYPGGSFVWTHPNRLATTATLLGMRPPPVAHCRVLELGCGRGRNLIPLAAGLPQGEFIGIDLSACQIANGQAMAAALGLSNLVLRHFDILEVDGSFGRFDYIIAHGIYSWTPPAVQDKILAICKRNLAPNGVAYVSYNTYPGWRLYGLSRDFMLYHTRHMAEPAARAAQARAALAFLAEAIPAVNGFAQAFQPYVAFLQRYLATAADSADSFLLHDELAEINEPVYFHQFAAHAANHGLQYLAEAEFRDNLPTKLPTPILQKVQAMASNLIELEQYLDFVRNRAFRRTLLCHQQIRLNRRPQPVLLAHFYLTSQARLMEAAPELRSTEVEQFHSQKDETIFSTAHPVTKAALRCLVEQWPQAVSFERLLALAGERSGLAAVSPADRDKLAANLLQAYGHSPYLVELHVQPPDVAAVTSDRPVASPAARWQAQESKTVTNLYHQRVNLTELERQLLPALDGSRDRCALLHTLLEHALNHALPVVAQGQPVTEAGALRESLDKEIGLSLERFRQEALLAG